MGQVVALDGLLDARRLWRGPAAAPAATPPQPTGHATLGAQAGDAHAAGKARTSLSKIRDAAILGTTPTFSAARS